MEHSSQRPSYMGNRLSGIVTRTGDDGSTGLADGQRVRKDDARIEACGAVDELNSVLGLLLASGPLVAGMAPLLLETQHELFDLGGELSLPGAELISAAHVARLEAAVEHWNAPLPALREFVLPGGGVAAATCHLARTVCRRAERRGWALARAGGVGPHALAYLNRLSDLLFVLARVLARQHGGEVLWRHDRGRAGAAP
jgi:cob(I)alamin adenosyltransferase